jgi:phosphoribosylformimino-5-aminoimidazole carboxamide ribotide isomerase
MLVIPAVDVRNGKAVRLVQGRADQETVYDQNPIDAARRWVDGGARRVHLVDLDGAFDGEPKNAAHMLGILRAFPDCEFEIGGGLRTEAAVRTFVEAGAARCVIGTKAAEDRGFVERLAKAFPGRISVGVDAKNGKVATKGWVEVCDLEATELVRELAGLPLGEIIYTDIERDGMLTEPNFGRLEELMKVCPFSVIASGGVATLAHIQRAKQIGCYGCIVGKALFDGRIEIRSALALEQ